LLRKAIIIVGSISLPLMVALAAPTPKKNTYIEGLHSGTCMMPNQDAHTDVAASQKPGKELTLREAILLALRYNPDIQTAEIQRVVDKFSLRTAENEFELQYALTGNVNQTFTRTAGDSSNSRTSQFTPVISRKGEYGTDVSVTMNNPTTDGIYNPGIDLSLTQPLVRGFGKDVVTADLYSAEESEKRNKLNLRSTLIQTIVSVINAYRQYVIDQNNVVIQQLSVKDYGETIKMDEALIKAGRKAPSDVLQSKADYTQALFDLRQAENSAETSRLELLNTIGLPPETKINVPTDIEVCKDETPDLEKAYDIAMKNNIDYLSSTINVKIDQRDLLVAKDNNRMQLNFNMDASTGNGSGTSPNSGLRSLTNNKNTNLSFQLDLDVPIDDYSLKSAIVSAKATLETDRINLANTARQLKLTVAQDLDTVKANYDNIKTSKTALDLQQQSQDILRAKLKYGLVSTFEVITRQQDLDTARVQYVQTKINYLTSLTQLYTDMGIILERWNVKPRY